MDFGDRLQTAIAAQRNNDLEAAEATYREILAEEAEQPDALHFLGLLEYQRGEADKGIELIRRSIASQPANPAAHNNLGNILKVLERREEAAKAYLAALDLDNDHADAWNNIGLLLRAADRFPKAIEAFREAVRAAPLHPEGWHNLGLTLMLFGQSEEAADAFEESLKLGDSSRSQPVWLGQVLTVLGRPESAAAVFEQYLERHPGDPIAEHQLAAVRGMAPDRAPDEYVRRHFDSFANEFDEVLRLLQYRAPQLIAAAVERRVGDGAPLADVVDLGCGTGLCGPLIRQHCKKLSGIDLSVGMLRRAKATGAYDHLIAYELVAFLREVLPIRFDLAVCADTLCYFGALGTMMQALAPALKPGGAMIATVELLDPGADSDGAGFRIDSTGRYAHTEAHLRESAEAAGMALTWTEPAVLRKELSREVRGLVFEVELPAAG
jgi:predicted TPR repeat methyltransferase